MFGLRAKARVTIDRDVLQRRDAILREVATREAPRILFLFVAIIVAFDLGYWAVGIEVPASYYMSDAIQSSFALVAGILIARRTVPAAWVPAIFASAIVVNNLALNYQYLLVGYSAVGVLLLLTASYGVIVLQWRPFLISAAIMAAVTTIVLVTNDPEQGQGWVITMYTGLATSAVLLYGRRQAVLPLAIANRTIEQMALRDSLTGLFNRHGLDVMAQQLVAQARREGATVFAVFVDVDGLKRVNDTFGHAVGDLVIERTAEAVAANTRAADIACRWGGDEFLIVGVGDFPDADAFAARIVASIDTDGLDGRWEPSVTVGVADSAEEGVEEIVAIADRRMYARREHR